MKLILTEFVSQAGVSQGPGSPGSPGHATYTGVGDIPSR